MRIYREDWETARRLTADQSVPRFSDAQMQRVSELTKTYVAWYRAHPHLHNLLNLSVLGGLFLIDLLVLIGAAFWAASDPSVASHWFALALGASLVHGLVMYQVVIFTVHEGAAHDRIIQVTGPLTRGARHLANNACRAHFADPEYYVRHHGNHHGRFGTLEDGSFTNFVRPRRFLISLLPMSGLLDFNDFRTHSDTAPSLSRSLSLIIGTVYFVPQFVLMAALVNVWMPLLVLVLVGPWIGTSLDRLRESTEHNLMPLEARHGSRNFGLGFWGLLVGGGPWGQPCHLSHHLAPSLPWYLQCLLHIRLKPLMTPEQRRYFMLAPFVGYPGLLWQLASASLRAAGRDRVSENAV